jgi:hypothetical protein
VPGSSRFLPSTAASGVHLRRLRRSGDFSQWYTYGGARERPTVAGEVIPHLMRQCLLPLTRGAHCLDVTEVALFDPHAMAFGSDAAEMRPDG